MPRATAPFGVGAKNQTDPTETSGREPVPDSGALIAVDSKNLNGAARSVGPSEARPKGPGEKCGAIGRAPERLPEIRERLRSKLAGCIRTGNIILSSGKQTDFYFDGRLVSLDPEGSALIAELILEEIVRRGIQGVGGLTSGADPITSAVGILAYQKGVPLKLFYVRKAAKGHGMQKQVEGPAMPPGLRVALVDDVITTGGSLLQARDALATEANVTVTDAMVVIDREEGGRQTLEAQGIAVTSLFRKRDFLP